MVIVRTNDRCRLVLFRTLKDSQPVCTTMTEYSTKHRRQAARSFFVRFSPTASFFFGMMVATAALGLLSLLIVLPLAMQKPGAARTAAGSNTNTAGADVALIPATIAFRPVGDDEVVRGDPDAAVTLIEYSDLECPYCKRVHPTFQQLLKDYDGKIRWVFRHFPIASLHSKAPKEANAAECARAQGKYWEFIDLIYERTPGNNGLELAALPAFAEELGLDEPAFTACLDTDAFNDRVQRDLQDATKIGGRGTPHTLVVTATGKAIPVSGAVPIATFKQAIEIALKD